MESEVCMNESCGASLTTTAAGGGGGDTTKGWNLKSGGVANLCYRCSTAYEQQAFCELFHRDDTGWRECTSCGKRLHCGCIASSAFLELLDNGGVTCVSCSNSPGHKPVQKKREEKSKETSISVEKSVGETQLSSIDNRVNIGNLKKTMFTKLNDEGADNVEESMLPSVNHNASKSLMKHEENVQPSAENGLKDVFGSRIQTNLTIGLDASTVKPVFYSSKAIEGQDLKSTLSCFQQGTWSRHILPKSVLPQGFINANAGMSSLIRVARPPVEGRIKNQLLPRYWPRITDQELQQISGDSNATVVPLFEKVLSASDAGRIGRLVLPKACAEAYFPPISQPEGLPLRIQDVKGKEWLFQFRFWPNNNSRMYVLEGVTPCIQSMQLLAGDTVTFSRMEPEGKLLMGFRKASTSTPVQLLKGSMYPHLNEFSRNVNLPNRDIGWPTNEQLGSKIMAGSFPPSMLVPEKKRSRNIGSKSKRLLIESQETLELKHTWEESQEMLFPDPLLKPSIVTIDDNLFEEYEEPPVFGKGSIFSVCSSGEQEQWAQCDNCSKWRKLPADFLLPPKWTCQDNIWNQNRAACLAPEEVSPRELENLLRLSKDFQKRRNFLSHKPEPEQGHNIIVDAETASVAIWDNEAEPSVAMTTKHPRHRPGCLCIVCIQPPSGKGKHKPTCTCNVCMTVKRRFTTLMLRKKKRQSEHEASIVQKNFKEETDIESMQVSKPRLLEHGNSSKGHLDLNINSYRGDNHGQTSRTMMSLFQVANLPLEMYLRENGLTSLISEQQASSSSHVLPQETGEAEGGDEADDDCPAPVVQEGKVGKNDEPDNIQDTCL